MIIFTTLKKSALALVLFLISSIAAMAQTTYNWVGGNGSWAIATNWSSVPGNNPRTTPAATDILQFNDGGTYTVTAIPTQTIRQLLVTNNTNVTLQAATTNTLTINGPTLTNNLVVENGSTLQTSATNALTLTMTTTTNQRADISGTLVVRAGALTTTGVASNIFTVSGTGVVNHFGGTITGSAATLVFEDNSNYNYLGTGALTIPTATWATNSNVNITGITSTATIGGTAQSFGNFTYNCVSQGNVAVTLAATSTTRIRGDFNLQSTGAGTGSLSLKNGTTGVTLNVDGLYNQSGGTLNANIGGTAGLTLNLNGGFTQSGGTFNLSTAAIACVLNIGNNFNQSAGTFTQTSTTFSTVNFTSSGARTYSATGTITNTNLNYAVVSPAELTLNTTLTTAASRTFTINSGATLILGSGNLASAATTGGSITNSGTLIMGPSSVISGSGAFVNTSAATTFLHIGSQQGITTTGATGNIQVTGTRTYNVGANYIYTGTNGQVTGNGLPAALTGFVQINLQNNADQITFTNTVLSGASVNVRLRSGSLANAITYTNATNSILTYEGVAAQTTTDNEFPAVNGPRSLVINNPNGVTLHAARSTNSGSTNTLTLFTGTLNTTPTNVLTVLNTAVGAVVGGDVSSFVNGPLVRAMNLAGTYNFPVGDGAVFGGYSMLTTATAANNLRVQFVNSASGTVGNGLTALENYHWRVERTAGTTAVTYTPTLTIAGLVADSRVGYSTTVAGAYANQGGTNIGASITSVLSQTIDNTNPNAYYSVGTSGNLSGTITTPTLTLTTIADLLRTQIVSGNVIFELPITYTGEPTYPVNFTAFAEDGGGPYTIIIRPATGSTNFLTAGDPGTTNPLINLNGIDRLTIDGRAGGAGSIVWTFRNTRTVATIGPTFQFINDATFNTLTYLNVEGQNITTTSGTILFSTAAGLSLGNSNNTISFCNIRDRSDVAGVPANGIYSAGTAGISNSNNVITNNNIFNFWAASSAGVSLASNNNAWQITNNSFYQSTIKAGIASAGTTAISIVATSAGSDNFTVTGNFIGGSQPSAAGAAWAMTGNTTHTFCGILINTPAAATNSSVSDNTITNIAWQHGAAGSNVVFVGIRNTNGANTIENNTIGATTGTGSITITGAFTTALAGSHGIYLENGAALVNNNRIGSITLQGATVTAPLSFIGINLITGGTAVPTITNNTIGSTTSANSIQLATSYNGTLLQSLSGILFGWGSAATISGNTIANMSNAYSGTTAGATTAGIAITTTGSVVRTVNNNTIFNISHAGGQIGTGLTASLTGISLTGTTAGFAHQVVGNTIHSLVNTHPTAAVQVLGILYNGNTTSGTIARNNIHSLSAASTSSSSSIIGINAFAGIATYHNNMIRLGIDAAGASIANGFNIAGIQQTSATANNLYYFNTIFIGGTATSSSVNTFAFQRIAGTTAINLRNNIFFNERSTASGTGINYALGLNDATGVTSNYNIYKTDGTNGNVGRINLTSYVTLVDWQNTFSSNDVNSLYGPVPFLNATGNAADVDLHIDTAIPAQVESAGIFIATFGDFDGDIRFGEAGYAGTGTAPDMGADEGNFLAADLTPPTIVYTPIPTQVVLSGPGLSATITDASGVNSTIGTRPRLYFKYASNANTFAGNTSANNGWKWVEASNATSPFNFTIDYSLLFGGLPTGGEVVDYFVVAQDLALPANVGINSGDFATLPSSVNLTAAAFPVTGTVNSFLINVLSGTVTVGTSGTYPSLTNNGGLFQAINTGALSSNLVAEIIGDLTAETGTHALNQFLEVGAGGYTLTIRPDGNTTRVISGTYSGANAAVAGLFRFDGADRVIVDGRNPADLAANGRHLIFRNINTASTATNSTFNLLNNSDNVTLRNLQVEGATSSGLNGVVRISSDGTGDGNDFITITECIVRDRSDAAGIPANGIYIIGALGRENNDILITNNQIFNYHLAGTTQHAGIFTGSYCTNFTITGNSIFDPTIRNTASYKMGIWISSATGSGANFNVSDNFIGGNAAGANGTWTVSASGLDYRFCGIWISCSITGNSEVSDNTIRNFSITTGSSFQTQSSVFAGIYVQNGDPSINNNTIGGSTNNISITNSAGQFTWVYGIFNENNAGVSILDNTIGGYTVANSTSSANIMNMAGIRASSSSSLVMDISGNVIGGATSPMTNGTGNTYNTTTGVTIAGILVQLAQPTTIQNNTVSHISYTGSGQSTSGAFQVAGIFRVSAAAVNTITGNQVNNIISNSPYNGSGVNVGLAGIYGGGTTNGQNFSENTIHTIRNTNANAVAVRVYGMFYTGNTGANNSITRNFIHSLFANSSAITAEVAGLYVNAGNALVSNNMVRIGIDENGNPITRGHNFNGIQDQAGSNNYFHNSVYVGGNGVAIGAVATHAFFSAPATGTRTVQNNIFWNARSNDAATAKHHAIRVNTLTGFTASHNVLLANGTGGVLGNMNGTDQTSLTYWGAGNINSNPEFIDPIGNATDVDLHIKLPPSGTPIESAGTPVAAVTNDFDGDDRASNTPVDIGADAGLFQPIDNVPPDITFTPVSNACNSVSTYFVSGFSIVDNGNGSSVNTTSGSRPRIYYKKSTDANDISGWKFVEASNTSSPFEFTIDYTLLNAGSVNINDQIQYFIVAQDQGPLVFTPNVAINSGAFANQPTSVALTASAFPIGGSINSFLVLPCEGVVTVGTGGDYPALTTATGVFQAINNSNLTGNLTIEIVSNITIEDGTHGLNQFAAPHTIEIRSNGSPWTISGTFGSAPNGLFRLNGADRVTVNGGTGAQRLLTFRNTNVLSNNATWHIYNDAQNLQFNNLTLEGGATSTLASGVVLIGSGATGGSGNDNISILRCDIRDLTTSTSYSRNGIYAAGTSALIANDNVTVEDCRIFNFYSSGAQSSGIRIETFNAGWTIRNNDFYQTVTQNAIASTEQYVIYINTVTGQVTVDGNRIGGSGVNLSGNWQISPAPTTPSTYRFVGIWQNAAPASGHQIINNTIDKMIMQSSSGANTNYGVYSGIYVAAGNSTINTNQIGNNTVDAISTPSLNLASNSNGAHFYGIRNIGTGTLQINNNSIGGIQVSNATLSGVNTGVVFHGISSTSGSSTISGNLIGSTSQANNIAVTGVNATSNPVTFNGILATSGSAFTVNILNNTIQNIVNGGLTSNGVTAGILCSSGGDFRINGNTIGTMRGAGTQSSLGSSAAVYGISLATSVTSSTINNNTVFDLVANGLSSSGAIIGITFSGGNTNQVNGNFIHSFNHASPGSSAQHIGIEITNSAGTGTFSNNIIRLGRRADGNDMSADITLTGIYDADADAQNIWFNTILIDGTASSSTNRSFAYRRIVILGSDNIRNNIFANNRTGSSGTPVHYAFATNTTGGLTALNFDNNIFYSLGLTTFSLDNGSTNLSASASSALRLQALRGSAPAGNNLRSGIATWSQINFVNPFAALPDLRLNNANAAAGAGVQIAAITSDFDGVITRANPPAIGAHESASFNALNAVYDIYTPLINLTGVPTVGLCSPTQTVNITATITDLGTGIATSGVNQPHLWWRRSAPSATPWASVTSVSSTGNANNGTYTFELNISPVAGETYQYYVVSEDVANTPNRWFSHFGVSDPVHPSVSVQTTAALNPASFNTVALPPLQGTVTVGVSGDFPNFNQNPGGLFHAINTRGLSGNLEVQVISNINESSNWTPLNAPNEFCGSDYTITIRPNAATTYIIDQPTGAANAVLSFTGARRVVFDGSFNGSGRFLLFRHNRTAAGSTFPSTIEFNNSANNITFSNCIIEGANPNFSNNVNNSCGVIKIGGPMGFASGNINNIVLQNNQIRNISNITQSTATSPAILVYLGGASSSANINNITITGNEMLNFAQAAIQADNGSSTTSNSIGNNFTITDNLIYQPLAFATYQYPIYIDALGFTRGHIISNNKIGGSTLPNPTISGTWLNPKTDGELIAIYCNVDDAPSQSEGTLISNNTISNITLSGTGYGNFIGIRVARGRVSVNSNTIGSLASSLTVPNIVMAGSGDIFDLNASSMMAGIWTQSTQEVVIDNNIICGLSNTGDLSFFDGIAHGSNLYFNYLPYQTPGGKATITNNQILFNRSNSRLQSLILSSEAFMGIFCWTNAADNLIQGNKIRNCGSGTTLWNRNVRIHGMFVGVYGSTTAQTGIVSNNEISHLFNENPGDNTNFTSRNPIVFGMSIANGNWTVANNTIFLNNGTQGGTIFTDRNTSLRGLNDGMLFNQANCQARYYNNTVYVSGSNLTGAGQANSTYAFLRFPLDYSSSTITAGAPIELRNNIFINDRGGLGNHRAIGNIANTNANAAINWNSSTSDYNFFSSTSTTANVALWGSSTTYTLGNWQSLSGGGDANTTHVITTTGASSATQVNPSELFINVGTGAANLRIIESPPNDPWPYSHINGNAIPLASVTNDIDNDLRDPATPDKGADEFLLCAAPLVTTPPANQNVCEGLNTSFTVVNSGLAPFTYQWQESTDGGTTWNNLSNSGIYSGVDLATLTLTGVPFSANNNQYRVVITNTCGNVTSVAATLTVNQSPQVTALSPPSFINSICEFSNTGFGVTATGAGLTYQWELSTDNGTSWNTIANGGNYSGATNSFLFISNVPPTFHEYQYRVVVTGTCAPSVTSVAGTLLVGSVAITSNPPPTTDVCNGGNTSISVTATGNSLMHTWEVSTNGGVSWSLVSNGGVYSGATTATLNITGATLAMNGYRYRAVVFSGPCPQGISSASILNVNPVVSASVSIIPNPGATICDGTSVTFNATPVNGGTTPVYQWYLNGNPVGTNSSSYTNAALVNGDQVYVEMTSTAVCPNPSVSTSNTVTMTVNPLLTASVSISVFPGSTICQSTLTTFTALPVNGGATPVYQWYLNGNPVGTNSDTYVNSTLVNGDQVYVEMSTSATCGSPANTSSNTITMTVRFPGQWIGNTSDWDTPTNWGCGGVPLISTDVVIPSAPEGGSFPLVSSNGISVCRSLLIETGASVTVGSSFDLSVYGNFENNGVASLGNGLVKIMGNSTNTWGGTTLSILGSLEVNNSGSPALELDQDIAVAGTINFQQGNIHLNGSDIDLGTTGSISNETNSRRIYGDAGEVKYSLNMAANTSYTNIAGMGVSIATGNTAPGVTQVNRGHKTHEHSATNNSIRRYFDIIPTVNSGLDATLRIFYFDAELDDPDGVPHNKADMIPWRSVDYGTTWEGQFFPSQLSNDIVNNWVQQTQIPAFSRWTLSDYLTEPLPIQLLSFTATANYALNQVDLNWVTASETNNAFFTVERTTDLTTFTSVVTKPGAGNSNVNMYYSDVDLNPVMGLSYYRLKQTDYNGDYSYSQLVPVFFGQSGVSTLNGLFTESGQLMLNHSSAQRGQSVITVMDAAGRIIFAGQTTTTDGKNIYEIPSSEWAAGIYMVRLVQNGEVLPLKVVKSH